RLLMACAVVVGGAGILYGSAFRMPTMGNILIKYGIGPLTLRDTHLLHLDSVPALPDGFWLAVTIASLFGAGMLLVAVFGAIGKVINLRLPERSDTEVAGAFLLLAAIIYLLPLLMTVPCDRYFIPVLPLLIAAILCMFSPQLQADKAFKYIAIVVVIAAGIFSIGATKDYFAWNRARWAALADLQNDRHISVDDIDGGLEFNGLYAYDPEYQRMEGKSWWWVKDDTYLIGFQQIFDYKVLKSYEYSHWLPSYTGKIVVLEKDPSQGIPME
ncbi:MAG TPA: hypothetical protein VLC91_09600, partial [Spongiibacteraceae bacterium]|nr:hypothetical protein [Spongiibacteraceae bacterium]